jgi:hypothetical protein
MHFLHETLEKIKEIFSVHFFEGLEADMAYSYCSRTAAGNLTQLNSLLLARADTLLQRICDLECRI